MGLQARTLGLPVMVAFPVAYDAMWGQWYMHRFVGDDPFRRRAINIKTLAMVAMGAGYRATANSSLPKHWRPPARHTHVAVEDAIEQGELFMNIVRELNAQRGDIALPSSRETDSLESLRRYWAGKRGLHDRTRQPYAPDRRSATNVRLRRHASTAPPSWLRSKSPRFDAKRIRFDDALFATSALILTRASPDM